MESTFQINNDSVYDESLYADYNDDSFDNYDESYAGNDENGEFILPFISQGLGAVNRLISGGIGAVSNGVQTAGRTIGNILGVNPIPASTSGIQGQSNLQGSVQTTNGRSVPVRLPGMIATKDDIKVVTLAIARINAEVKKVSEVTNANGVALTNLSKKTDSVDAKHIAATRSQNRIIHRMGREVDKLEKKVKEVQSNAQMTAMFSLISKPQIESLTFNSTPTGNVATPVTNSVFKTDMLPLIMAMSGGGFGGSGSGDSNNMMNNPLMMILLMGGLK